MEKKQGNASYISVIVWCDKSPSTTKKLKYDLLSVFTQLADVILKRFCHCTDEVYLQEKNENLSTFD